VHPDRYRPSCDDCEKKESLPVPLIKVGPCTVTQIKTVTTDGYNANPDRYRPLCDDCPCLPDRDAPRWITTIAWSIRIGSCPTSLPSVMFYRCVTRIPYLSHIRATSSYTRANRLSYPLCSSEITVHSRLCQLSSLPPFPSLLCPPQSVVSSPGQLLEAKGLLEDATPRFNIRLNCTCYNPVIKVHLKRENRRSA
jgi:hypothetical protein